jgi:hypothetical protein
MPSSQGGSGMEDGPGRLDGGSRAGDPWSMVPVQRVSPASQSLPSAPHTTPQHTTQPLDADADADADVDADVDVDVDADADDDMVLG